MSKNKVPLEDSSDELEHDEEAQQLIRQAEEKKRAKAKSTEPPTTPKKPSSADHPLTPSRSSPRKTPRKTPNKECYSICSGSILYILCSMVIFRRSDNKPLYYKLVISNKLLIYLKLEYLP